VREVAASAAHDASPATKFHYAWALSCSAAAADWDRAVPLWQGAVAPRLCSNLCLCRCLTHTHTERETDRQTEGVSPLAFSVLLAVCE
jgi:hypothetical protein